MLKIIINGQEIDLGGLTGLTLNYNPGIFDLDGFEGSYVIPFTIPDSHINASIFNFQNKINAKNRNVQEFNAELWHSGVQMDTGIIKATQFQNKNISCNFYLSNGEIFKAINEKSLPENDFGDDVVLSEYDDGNKDYILFPVKNPDFFIGTIMEDYGGTDADYQNQFVDDLGGFFAAYTITPFPRLYKVLNKLFTNLGFLFTDDYFTAGYLKDICIFNTNNAFIYNIDGVQPSGNLAGYNAANHLPDMSTAEFLKAISAFFNIVFHVQGKKLNILNRDALILSAAYDDISDKQVGYIKKTLSGIEIDGISLNMIIDDNDTNLADFPDIADETTRITEVSSLPAAASSTLNSIVFYYNTMEERASYYKFAYNGALTPNWQWTRYPESVNDGYKYPSAMSQLSVKLLSKNLEINANLSSVADNYYSEAQVWSENYYPKVKQIGNSNLHSQITPFSLRLMIYTGIKTVEGVPNVPHGGYSIGNNPGFSISGWWSYINRWKHFMIWYTEAIKEELEIQLQLTASEIKNFDFSRKKLIDGNLFFVKSMSVQILRTEIKPAICKLIKA